MPAPLISIFEGSYDEHIRLAADKLRQGGVVVVPMETVYGGAAALNRPEGLDRLKKLQSAGTTAGAHAFIPHLARSADASQFLGDVGEFGQRCLRKLWP